MSFQLQVCSRSARCAAVRACRISILHTTMLERADVALLHHYHLVIHVSWLPLTCGKSSCRSREASSLPAVVPLFPVASHVGCGTHCIVLCRYDVDVEGGNVQDSRLMSATPIMCHDCLSNVANHHAGQVVTRTASSCYHSLPLPRTPSAMHTVSCLPLRR